MNMFRGNWLIRFPGLWVFVVLAVAFGDAAAGKPRRKMPRILRGVKRILFYGDSLTDGSDYPDYVVNTLNRLYPKAGFEILNSAVCGDTAERLCQRLKADVLERRPDLVIICVGTNDCVGKRPVTKYKAELEYLVKNIRQARAKVILMTPSHLGQAEREKRFQNYLRAIREVAASRKLIVADAHAEFLKGEKAGREMLGADGVHHGKHGFEGMARAILDALGLKDVPVEKRIRPWPGLLTKWETSAPVPNKRPYSPAQATNWQAYDRQAAIKKQPWWDAPFAARGGWMPFALGKPKQPAIAYGRTYYHAKKAETGNRYELQIGGSRPLVVWLNGKKVWTGGRPHGYHPDADRITVEMKPGRNEIIVVSNFMAFIGVKEKRNP